MTSFRHAAAALSLLVLSSAAAHAQTADEIIEKHLAATGGRAALSKLTSRVSTGSISLTTPVGEVAGTIEVSAKTPNKSRTLIKLDLTALGAGTMTSDQRFDGTTGYVIDSLQGNREIGGDQAAVMRSTSFPSPLLDYKAHGTTVTLDGQEKVGAKDAYALTLKPQAGPSFRLFIETDTFMLVKTVIKLNVPEAGGDIEQTIELSDFRDVDGFKIPFVTKSSNRLQSVSSVTTEVKHNVPLDDSSFAKPAQ